MSQLAQRRRVARAALDLLCKSGSECPLQTQSRLHTAPVFLRLIADNKAGPNKAMGLLPTNFGSFGAGPDSHSLLPGDCLALKDLGFISLVWSSAWEAIPFACASEKRLEVLAGADGCLRSFTRGATHAAGQDLRPHYASGHTAIHAERGVRGVLDCCGVSLGPDLRTVFWQGQGLQARDRT